MKHKPGNNRAADPLGLEIPEKPSNEKPPCHLEVFSSLLLGKDQFNQRVKKEFPENVSLQLSIAG